MSLSLVIAGSWLSDVAVAGHCWFLVGGCFGGRCWFLVVGCRFRWSLLIPYCRLSLSVVIAGSWLFGVAVGGRCWFLAVGYWLLLSFSIVGAQLCLSRGSE